MSSHHFVKEDQEPAVLFLSDRPLINDHVLGLLEWSPRVMAWESAVPALTNQKVNIDQVYAKNLNQNEHLLEYYSPLELIECPEPKMVVQHALNQTANQNITAINIILNQEDVIPTAIALNSKYGEIVFCLYDTQRKYLICKTNHFEKWYPKNTSVSVYSLSENLVVSTNGLVNDLSNELVEKEHTSLTKSDGLLGITTTNSEVYLIAENLISQHRL